MNNRVLWAERGTLGLACGTGSRRRYAVCLSAVDAGPSFQPNRLLMRRFYLITRDLHLYIGLFLSPFVLAFAVSVFYLVHGPSNRPSPGPSDPSRTVANVNVNPEVAKLQGRARVDALRPVIEQLDVRGEIDFVRHVASEHRLIVPVRLPRPRYRRHDRLRATDGHRDIAKAWDRRRIRVRCTRCQGRTMPTSGETPGSCGCGAWAPTPRFTFCCSLQ